VTPLRRAFAAAAAALLAAAAGGALAQPAFRAAASASVTGVAYVASGTASVSGNCGTGVAPSTPAGETGNLLVALYSSSDSSGATPSAGWNTLLASNPVADHTARIFWRIADGSGSDSLTVTRSGTCNVAIGQIARFRNVDQANPFDSGAPIPAANCTAGGTRVKCSYQNSGTVTSGEETTVTANGMSIFAVFIRDNNATGNPAGFAEAFDSGSGTGVDVQISLKYREDAAAGTLTAVSIGKGGGSDPNHGVLFALRPASPSLTIAAPTGTQVGDLLVAAIAVQPSDVVIDTPAGWTAQTATVQPATNSSRQQVFVKFAGAGDLVSHTWTFSGGQHTGAVGGISGYVGVDTTTPIDAFGGNVTPSGTTHTANSIATLTANTRVVSAHSFTSSRTWAAPAGMTERVDVASLTPNNANGLSMEMADVTQAAAGATGNKTANAGGNADVGVAHLIALRTKLYFDIVHGDYALICGGEAVAVTVTVRNADGTVQTGYTGTIALSTSTGNGTWALGTGNGTFTPGAGGTASYSFSALDQGTAQFSLTNTVAGALTVSVQDTATGITNTGATITFSGSGYSFTLDTVQVAGRPQSITVEYLVSPACTPSSLNGHNANKNVKLWLDLSSTHPGAATLPGATGVTSVNPLPTAEPGANNITLAFVAGTATFTLTTTDVGKYSLNMRDANTARRGSSSAITTRPFGLAIRGATDASAIQHGADHTSAVFAAAGDNFTATVAAYLWAAGDDANNDGVPDAGADITNNGLVPRFAADVTLAPSVNLPGTALGSLSRGVACNNAATVASASFSGGAATVTDWCYSEVGNVYVTATATNYLGSPGVNVTGNSGLDGTGAAGGHVGRFRPKRFALDTGAPPTLVNRVLLSCAPASTFSYMDEGLRLTLRLLAQNAQGATTQNYTGLYARHDPSAGGSGNAKTAFALGARSGTTDLTARVSAIYAGATPAWSSGVLDVPAANAIRAAVARASPDNPDGPYAGTSFGIAPTDADGVLMATYDLDVDNNASNDHTSLGVSTEVRFGRLRMLNALGSEKLALPIPIQVQYWTGNGFALNASDSCTVLGRDNVTLDFTPASNLVACETAINAATIPFASGVGTLTLAAPGAGNNGSVLLTPQLRTSATGNYCPSVGGAATPSVAASLRYLLGRWNDAADPDTDANTSYDDNPAARAAFGLYGSQPSNFIYFRENY